MTRGLSYDQLVEILIRNNKNVLILDTCCLLDIIRCLPREKMDVFDSALNISNAIEGDTLGFSIVLPSLVPQEWEDHVNAVMSQTEKFINKQFNSLENLLRNIRRIISGIGLDNIVLNIGAFNKLGIDRELRTISCKIMCSGYVCETGAEITNRAMTRMTDNIRPARSGRNNAKDCVIYEEVLHISGLLRNVDFDKKIIFASSNTKEYCIDDSLHPSIKKPHPSIKKELCERKVRFVTSLDWAEWEAKTYDLQTTESIGNGT